MASNEIAEKENDEIALLRAAEEADVGALTSLLQKGVCPNVYDKVPGTKEERECLSAKREEEGGKVWQIFSSLLEC